MSTAKRFQEDNLPIGLLIFFVLQIFIFYANGLVALTNLKCTSLRKDMAIFEKCILKILKRNVVSAHVFLKICNKPANNITVSKFSIGSKKINIYYRYLKVNLQLWRKFNGYRPFLYNVTTDYCAFMVKPTRIPFLKIYIDAFRNVSNAVHTCPIAVSSVYMFINFENYS